MIASFREVNPENVMLISLLESFTFMLQIFFNPLVNQLIWLLVILIVCGGKLRQNEIFFVCKQTVHFHFTVYFCFLVYVTVRKAQIAFIRHELTFIINVLGNWVCAWSGAVGTCWWQGKLPVTILLSATEDNSIFSRIFLFAMKCEYCWQIIRFFCAETNLSSC